MSTEPQIQAAAVVFRHDEHDRRALADFARELADGGCRLAGMVQEAFFDDQGRRTHIDSVDLATGDRVMINQPSRTWPHGSDCTLDTAALADAGANLNASLEAGGFLAGDIDLNGDVEFADFLLISSSFGGEGHYGQGDVDCSGNVDFADFLILSANFGKSSPAAAVPEPKGPNLGIMSLCVLAAFRRPR